MKNLGYENLEEVTPGMTNFIKKNFFGAKFMKLYGKEYYIKIDNSIKQNIIRIHSNIKYL